MSSIYSANVAKAKILFNKNNDTYRIVIAFNVTERTKNGTLKFPVQAKCNFVSGDFVYETLLADKERILNNARQVLRTNNIEFVS